MLGNIHDGYIHEIFAGGGGFPCHGMAELPEFFSGIKRQLLEKHAKMGPEEKLVRRRFLFSQILRSSPGVCC